jgi:circadian clock protein KaiC
MLILAQHGLVSATQAPVDLSYLADTVVTLRYFEDAGEVKQAIAVIKKRSGYHEKTIREFKLNAGKGIHIGQPLKDFHGILTGSPMSLGKHDLIMKASDAPE